MVTTEVNYNTNPNIPIVKRVHIIGTKKIVSIDQSIVQRMKIKGDTLLEQEISEDGKDIVMRIRNLEV